MDAIFQNVWEMSLFVIPVILFFALLSNKLGKRYGAKWRYLLWMVVAVRLCMPVQIDLPAPMMGMKMEVPSVQNGAREVLEAKNPEYLAQSDMDKAQMEEFRETISEANGYVLHVDFGVPDDHDFFDFFLAYPEMLWLIGVLLFLVWQGRKYSSFKKMLERNRRKVIDASVLDIYYTLCKDMGLKKQPEFYFCEPLPSPLCVGFFHPAVYINSEEREEGDLRLILKHELTHCKRKDLWLKGILMLSRALHFFNPFVHWMAKLVEKDMELSCDLAVMENCSMEERQAYSMAILRTVKEANSKNMRMSTAFSGGKEELKARFENIFDMTTKKRGIALFTAAALSVCGGTAFVGCVAPEPKDTPETSVVYGGYTERIVKDLYAAKLDYIGDHVGVEKIMGLLPLPDGVTPNEKGMELFTDVTPYGVMRHLNWIATAETAYEYNGEGFMDARWSGIHGMIFLVLVDNANYFEYVFHQGAEEENPAHGEVMIELASDRERMKRFFGDMDLREFASDEETFMNFVSAINRYYYEGIDTPKEIYDLMNLDDEAARKRMNDMLYKSEMEFTRKEVSDYIRETTLKYDDITVFASSNYSEEELLKEKEIYGDFVDEQFLRHERMGITILQDTADHFGISLEELLQYMSEDSLNKLDNVHVMTLHKEEPIKIGAEYSWMMTCEPGQFEQAAGILGIQISNTDLFGEDTMFTYQQEQFTFDALAEKFRLDPDELVKEDAVITFMYSNGEVINAYVE